RDSLTLAARQIGDGRVNGYADTSEADDIDQDFLGDLLLAFDVDEAQFVGDLPTHKEIAPQRLLLRQRFVLVDRLDRQIVRHANRVLARLNFALANEYPARSRLEYAGHDLDQCRLARS